MKMVSRWPGAGGPRFKPKKYIKILKNLLLQNCLAKMLKNLYIALPCGPLPSSFK